jgi:hypothetical protein
MLAQKNCRRRKRNRLWPKLNYYPEIFGENKEKRKTSVKIFGI